MGFNLIHREVFLIKDRACRIL